MSRCLIMFLAALCWASPAFADTLTLTVLTDPAGASVYEEDQQGREVLRGTAPVTLSYKLPPGFFSKNVFTGRFYTKTCIPLRRLRAVWASGAEASMPTPEACAPRGRRQELTLRPTEASGRAADDRKARPRIFVTDSQSWQIVAGLSSTSSGTVGAMRGGARPQTAEIVKTMNELCGEAIVTLKQENADYILLLEHEGGKGYALKDNKWALFNGDGDGIGSGSTRALGNSVKDACVALLADWAKDKSR